MTHATSPQAALVVVEDSDLRGKHVMTRGAVPFGMVVARITGHHVVAVANRFTIQSGADTHLAGLGPLTFLNHSCTPNVVINTTDLTVTAIRDIATGEELSFFYPSTEWQLAEPFACHCGSTSCIGVVAGAASLTDDTLSRYFVNEHVRDLRSAA